jgi:hypothetical protein
MELTRGHHMSSMPRQQTYVCLIKFIEKNNNIYDTKLVDIIDLICFLSIKTLSL